MIGDDIRRQEMFLRVKQLGVDEADALAPYAFVKSLFNSLSEIVTEVERHASAQASGITAVRQGTKSKGVARDELERDLAAIARTARSIAVSIPGLEKKFRFTRDMKDQELLTTARMFASDALPLKDEFIKRGMPADFLDDLNEDLSAFEQALTQRTQSQDVQVNATATIDDLIERGMNIVRQLDPIMRNIFEDNPGKLAAWLSASRVERAPRRRKQPQQTTTT